MGNPYWDRITEMADRQRTKGISTYGHTLDKRHMIEELGDVAWYLAVLCDAIGSDLHTVMEENLIKLEKRYPEGFDPYRSQHRNDIGG